MESRAVQFEPGVIFESGDIVETEVSWFLERLVRSFDIRDRGKVVATIPAGTYSTRQMDLSMDTFGGRAISGTFGMSAGGYYNGDRINWGFGPEFKPTKNLSFLPRISWGKVTLPDAAFRTQEINAAVNYSFSQQWLARTTVLMNSQDQQVGLNFRLNWIFRPGDDLFIVYNEARTYGDQGGLQDRALIVKMTYSLDY